MLNPRNSYCIPTSLLQRRQTTPICFKYNWCMAEWEALVHSCSTINFLTCNQVETLDSSKHLIAGTEKGSSYVTEERQSRAQKENEKMTCLAEVHTPTSPISTVFLSITDLLLQISEGHNSTRHKTLQTYFFLICLFWEVSTSLPNSIWFILKWTIFHMQTICKTMLQ